MAGGDELEAWLELDEDAAKVRGWRQAELERAGIDAFSAYRLAMRFELDLHKLVEAARGGATGPVLIDLYVD